MTEQSFLAQASDLAALARETVLIQHQEDYIHSICKLLAMQACAQLHVQRKLDSTKPPGAMVPSHCGARNLYFTCTLPAYHSGMHRAYGSGQELRSEWSDTDAVEPPSANRSNRCVARGPGNRICTLWAGHQGKHQDSFKEW